MAAPVNTIAPAISGALRVNATLVGVVGTWTGSPVLTQQWQRAMPVRDAGGLVVDDEEVVTDTWQDIVGATSLNYQLLPTETQYMVRRAETGTNGDGSAVAYTAQQGPIATYLPGSMALGAIRGALTVSGDPDE